MFSLRNKLFLAFLLSSALLAVSMLALFQWSFDRGFLNYIQRVDQKRLEVIGSALEQKLAQTPDWQALLQPGAAEQLMDGVRDFPRHGPGLPEFNGPLPPPPPDHFHAPPPRRDPRFRFFILDANRQPLAGFYRKRTDNRLRPLMRGETLVGYVGIEPKKVPQELIDQEFAESQSQNFIFMALIALAVSLLMAFPLASLLVKRINRLVEQVRQLSAGNYEHRIAPGGNDELNQLALHLNDLGRTLQETAHARRRMVADISHELRTPIATLRAQLEAIEDGVRPLNASAVQRLHEQVMRLSNLVHDLYELSLADIGALSYRKQPLDLRELVTTLANSMQPQFAQAGLALSVRDGSNAELSVFGDNQRLTQLFANLLQNSLQYTTSPGQVQVSIRTENQIAVISVEDSAPGVEKSVQPRLFERLFRAESSRNRNTGGAGLGLSLCQTIVEAHNGSIVAADSALGGLAVTVRIPLTQVAP